MNVSRTQQRVTNWDIHICTCIRIYMYMYTNIYVHVYEYICTCIQMYIYTCMRMRMHICQYECRNVSRTQQRVTNWHSNSSSVCYATPHANESCPQSHPPATRHTYRWVCASMSSHVTHMNKLCFTYACFMSYISVSHVTYLNESRHACASRHLTYMNKSRHTCQEVTSHTRIRVVTHMNTWPRTVPCLQSKEPSFWRTLFCKRDLVIHGITYRVATVSRIDKITGLFCRI